jgi:hypothetical protein
MKNIVSTLELANNLITLRKIILVAVIMLSLLLFKDVYSERTLIGNIEPNPDTLHYIVPARSLINGGPFGITREYGSIRTNVTPLYSLFLLPIYLINYDPRTYYFLNVLLAFSSFIIFSAVVRRLTGNKWVYGLTLLLYVSNYYIYWYPQWAMAENLLLTLFMLGANLIQSKVTSKKIIFASLIGASFFATKLSHASTSVVFGLIYMCKIFYDKRSEKRLKNITSFVIWSLVFWIPLLYFAEQRLNFHIFSSSSTLAKTIATSSASSSPWYSKEYIPINLTKYINAFSGGSQRFLWDYTPMYPKWIAFLGLTGLFSAVFVKRNKFFATALLLILTMQTIFMSSFYAFDLRYLYFVIPIILIGNTLFFDNLEKALRGGNKRVFIVIILIISGFYLSRNLIRIKDQIVLNLKYAEVPWHYKAVMNLNNYFSQKALGDDRPFVISSQPPYYIDFYSNGNYRLLPLSKQQDFRSDRENVWGPGDYSDFTKLYDQKLKDGDEVYFSSYGLGIEGYLHSEFTKLQENFKVTLLTSNCFDLCNIYRVEMKD